MATDVQVPALGESITEGTLAQWLKKPGEAVKADEPIASLETDKVSVEVPSPVAGVLTEQLVEEGDNVAVGAVIARIDQNATAAAAAPAAEAASASTNPAGAGENPQLRGSEHAPEPASAEAETSAGDEDHITTLSPAVRRAVLEYHVDPTKIKGTGKDGRLTKDDVIAAAEAQKSGTPAQAGAQAPEAKAAPSEAKAAPPGPRPSPGDRREERVKMSRLRQTIAKRLKDAQNTAAMLTTSKDVPSVNASLEGDEIVYHDYLDVSIAVSAPKGLVVPVVRNADRMSFAEIEKTIAAYGKKAKEGTLTVEEMQGGTFTISNGGVFGSLLSTPIINPPQSAVLGMHRIEERPVVKDGEIVARPMMYLALSYDHRIIDGREA